MRSVFQETNNNIFTQLSAFRHFAEEVLKLNRRDKMNFYLIRKMIFGIVVTAALFSCDDASLRNRSQDKHKIETVNRQRCTFNVTDKLYLDRIDSSFNPEGYFKIKSYLSENMLQLFVFDTRIDVDEKLECRGQGTEFAGRFHPTFDRANKTFWQI